VSNTSSSGRSLCSARNSQSESRRDDPHSIEPSSTAAHRNTSSSPNSSNSSYAHHNHSLPVAPEDLSSSSDEEVDPALGFYKIARTAGHKVCPFATPGRENPCTTHDTPRVRKDAIMRHLKKVETNGGDEQHPLDDPLWNSAIVKYWLNPRP